MANKYCKAGQRMPSESIVMSIKQEKTDEESMESQPGPSNSRETGENPVEKSTEVGKKTDKERTHYHGKRRGFHEHQNQNTARVARILGYMLMDNYRGNRDYYYEGGSGNEALVARLLYYMMTLNCGDRERRGGYRGPGGYRGRGGRGGCGGRGGQGGRGGRGYRDRNNYGIAWPKESFSRRDCNAERQQIVEFWRVNGSQYMFFSQRVTWDEGRMLCLNYNARLAVLDNAEKAITVAKSIADSNIEMVDSWIGGRRIDFSWTWIDAGIGPGMKTAIPTEPNVENFPPWTREPTRPTKECLAIDRRSHDLPNFVDLDCRLQRPIICEKKFDDVISDPVPSKWIQISRSTYTLYHGKVTWHEAATFCRTKGTRLAILKTSSVVDILTNGMTKTRPDFEAAWIGAYFSYGQWTWMATGSFLNPLTDASGYPPWRFGRPGKNDGCLLLDRHLEDSTNFIETNCDKRRDFVCEEYPQDEDEDWLNEPAKFAHGNSTYIIYPVDKTWSESRSFCNERGSVLAHVGGIDTLKLIIEAMGDHPRGIRHVWLGGEFRSKADEWFWIDDNEKISKVKNSEGFPPWALIDTGLDYDPASSSCLNLDRTDHVKPHFYGLDCISKQPFVCKITCDVPPLVNNGLWKCYGTGDGRECSLKCDKDRMVMGVRNVTCAFSSGWATGLHWLEFPLCMRPKEYTSRMIRSLSHDMQKSAGYYILIDHIDPTMHSLSLKLAERLVTAFPVSRNLQMGMTCFSTSPSIRVPFNQTNNCQILQVINSAKKQVTNLMSEEKNYDSFHSDISMFNARRILIIAILDSKRASAYADTIEQFKSSGHHVTIIGLEEHWKTLLPLATVGFDRRSNLFLFDYSELEKIIQELERLEKKPSKCKNFLAIDRNATTISSLEEVLGITLPNLPGVPTINDGSAEPKKINSEERSNIFGEKKEETEQLSTDGAASFDKNEEDVPQASSEQESKRDPEEPQVSEQTITEGPVEHQSQDSILPTIDIENSQ